MTGELGIDLQAYVKRIYFSLLYNSTFYKFLNENYIGEVRQTGAPIIEVLKSNAVSVNVRSTAEIATGLTPTLSTYGSVKVDLTELKLDYSFRIPVLVAGSNILNAVDSAIREKDSELAIKVDTYGYDMLADAITGDRTGGKTAKDTGTTYTWNPANNEGYIKALNALKAKLFNVVINTIINNIMQVFFLIFILYNILIFIIKTSILY